MLQTPGTLSSTSSSIILGKNEQKEAHVLKQSVVKTESVLVVVFMSVVTARLTKLVIAIRATAGTGESAWTRGIAIWIYNG